MKLKKFLIGCASMLCISSTSFAAYTVPLGSQFFGAQHEGSDIHDGVGAFTNSWSEISGGGTIESVSGSTFGFDHTGSGVNSQLDGTSASTGGSPLWTTLNTGDWTLEISLRLDSPNGFAIWAGVGTNRAIVTIYDDRVSDLGSDSFNVTHTVDTAGFHDYRIAYDASEAAYHVWRDKVELTSPSGAALDFVGGDNRLLFGDYTNGTFGDNFDADIAFIRFDGSGAYAPTPEPSSFLLSGLGAFALFARRRKK